jgi:hypothetical protein
MSAGWWRERNGARQRTWSWYRSASSEDIAGQQREPRATRWAVCARVTGALLRSGPPRTSSAVTIVPIRIIMFLFAEYDVTYRQRLWGFRGRLYSCTVSHEGGRNASTHTFLNDCGRAAKPPRAARTERTNATGTNETNKRTERSVCRKVENEKIEQEQ